MNLLVAHDVGLPEIVGADDNAVEAELLAALLTFLWCQFLNGFQCWHVLRGRLTRVRRSNLNLVIYFDLGVIADGSDDLIVPGYNLVAFLEAAECLNIRGAADAGFDCAELALFHRQRQTLPGVPDSLLSGRQHQAALSAGRASVEGQSGPSS